jgi:uncharacterized membrane protein YdbT with pleckstrin-like domain
MSYVMKVLQPGESVVYSARLHWFVYLPAVVPLVIAAALAAGALELPRWRAAFEIGAGVFLLFAATTGFRAFVRRATTELSITSHRVIYKAGLFSRHTIEMSLGKVESVDVDQSILGRIFGYGTVVVRGTGGSLEPIRNIGDPLAFRNNITAG